MIFDWEELNVSTVRCMSGVQRSSVLTNLMATCSLLYKFFPAVQRERGRRKREKEREGEREKEREKEVTKIHY